MRSKADHTRAVDSGLCALVVLLRFLGFRVHVDHVRERFGKKPIGTKQMVRCAKDLGLRARVQTPSLDRLKDLALPAIAALRDGGFLILGQISEDALLIQYATSSQPETITRAEFESIWDGRLVLMTHPRTWSDRAKILTEAMANAIRSSARSVLTLVRGPSVSTATRWVANLIDSLRARKVAEAPDADQVTKSGGAAIPAADDAGLAAFVMMLRVHGIGADAEQIRHQRASATIGVNEMLRCAKQLGLKARVSTTRWDRLSVTPLPAIAALRDGRFLILGKVSEDKVLIQISDLSTSRGVVTRRVRGEMGRTAGIDGTPRVAHGAVASL
jgi:subfamily B ATP-binding cassette protein HlyB/CyaB